ncbi:MAG: thioredoxin [Candidatus Omnitrophota bacterium]
MLTILPSLRFLFHRKYFFKDKKDVMGYNILLKNARWGYFSVSEGSCANFKNLPCLTVDYNCDKNSFVTKGVIDYVRCIEKHKTYLGRFNVRIGGRILFLGYFSLIKKTGGNMSDLVKDINDNNFSSETAQGVCLVDFWAPWCAPCQMSAPMIEELAKSFAGKVNFFKVNIDEDKDSAEKFGVMSIPTFVILKGGKEVGRVVGAVGSGEIKNKIEEALI